VLIKTRLFLMTLILLFFLLAACDMPLRPLASQEQVIAKSSLGDSCPIEDSFPRCGERTSAVVSTPEGIAVGTITVSNDDSTLFIELKTTDDWYYDLSQISVTTSLDEIPMDEGTPVYDLFPFLRSYDPYFAGDCFLIPLDWDVGTELYFVFRAVVVKIQDDVLITETIALAEGEGIPGSVDGTYFSHAIQACGDDPPEPEPPEDLTGLFRTQTQGGWGAKSAGENAGYFLETYFALAFPDGLIIGSASAFTAEFLDAETIGEFLPAGGIPGPLQTMYEDPLWTEAGVLAGQVTALALNVGFDNYAPDFGSSIISLGDLLVADLESPCYGWTVSEVLSKANAIIGGSDLDLTYDEINECVSQINENFVDGVTDNGFLRLPD
jgi:hypothetical protein